MTISDKHGLNPSLDMCFFCGVPKGIALFGKLKNDIEAPRQVLLNYEPCDECQKVMSQGTTIIEVVTDDNGNKPIHDNVYPTGRWCVMKREAAQELFNTDKVKVLLNSVNYTALTSKVNPEN